VTVKNISSIKVLNIFECRINQISSLSAVIRLQVGDANNVSLVKELIIGVDTCNVVALWC